MTVIKRGHHCPLLLEEEGSFNSINSFKYYDLFYLPTNVVFVSSRKAITFTAEGMGIC